MVELPGWIKTLPDGVTVASDDLSSQFLVRFGKLVGGHAAPGMGAGDEHRSIRWPNPSLSVRVFAEGIVTEGGDTLNYRPPLEQLLSKYSPSGVGVWGIGFQKYGVFLSAYDDDFRWWVKGQLIFSPTVVIARDIDLIIIADEQMHYSVVGASPVLMEELEAALGGENVINEAINAFIDDLGIGFGEEDRAWAKKFLRRETYSP